MSDVEIRAASAPDLSAVTEIYQHAILFGTATFELIPPDLTEMTRRCGREIARILHRETIGRPRPAYRFTVENSGYLTPAAQHRGIGTALLRRLIAEAEARGYRQMIAVIGDSANAGSIGVHTKTGFGMIGTHSNVGFKFGRWLDTVMMQRALGDGGATMPPALAGGAG
jgi:L-amino acid N-acyltransferase YncA